MSIHDGAAWKASLPSPTVKFVFVSLVGQASDDGVCWPSVGSVAKRTGLSDRAIQLAIKDLVRDRWIERVIRPGRSTVYQVNLEKLHQAELVYEAERKENKQGHPRTLFTPEGDSPLNVVRTPPKEVRGGGEPRSPRSSSEDSRKQTHATAGAAARVLQVELANALAQATGTALEGMTRREQTKTFAAAKQIRDAGGTADEVRARAARWPTVFRDATVTPLAIANNWGRLAGPKAPAQRTQRDERALAESEARGRAESTLLLLGSPADLKRAEGESWSEFAARCDAAFRARAEARRAG